MAHPNSSIALDLLSCLISRSLTRMHLKTSLSTLRICSMQRMMQPRSRSRFRVARRGKLTYQTPSLLAPMDFRKEISFFLNREVVLVTVSNLAVAVNCLTRRAPWFKDLKIRALDRVLLLRISTVCWALTRSRSRLDLWARSTKFTQIRARVVEDCVRVAARSKDLVKLEPEAWVEVSSPTRSEQLAVAMDPTMTCKAVSKWYAPVRPLPPTPVCKAQGSRTGSLSARTRPAKTTSCTNRRRLSKFKKIKSMVVTMESLVQITWCSEIMHQRSNMAFYLATPNNTKSKSNVVTRHTTESTEQVFAPDKPTHKIKTNRRTNW